MAADVSSLVRVMNGGDSSESATSGKSTTPITRDLLGGCCSLDSKELDLDLQVPCGWEKRLDLKSGKVYLQRCNSSNSDPKPPPLATSSAAAGFQDLNFPPTSSNPTTNLTLFDEPSLDLKLVGPLSASPVARLASNYQSVCTLDKVKSALERAEKETTTRKGSISMSKSKSKSCSPASSSSVDIDREERSTATIAAGCPGCLLYVLVSSGNPKCPRCNSEVPLLGSVKKPRIDLNMSI